MPRSESGFVEESSGVLGKRKPPLLDEDSRSTEDEEEEKPPPAKKEKRINNPNSLTVEELKEKFPGLVIQNHHFSMLTEDNHLVPLEITEFKEFRLPPNWPTTRSKATLPSEIRKRKLSTNAQEFLDFCV